MSGDLCTETGVTHKSRRSYFSPDGRASMCVCVRDVIFCPIPIGFLRVFVVVILFTVPSAARRVSRWSVGRGKKPSNNSAPPERFETQGSTKIQNKMIKYAAHRNSYMSSCRSCPRAHKQYT